MTYELTDEEKAAYQAKLAAAQAAAAEPSKSPAWLWAIGALVVVLLATAFWAAGRVDTNCQKVAGGQGQTLNVCVDENGNISDGDR